MNKTKRFSCYDDFETWAEKFDDCTKYQFTPVVIDDGWKITADMFTECKSWKTALNRFEKACMDENGELAVWFETMRECAENGEFSGRLLPAWSATEEEKKDFFKGGIYAWNIESHDDDYWYIDLVVSGVYAGYGN